MNKPKHIIDAPTKDLRSIKALIHRHCPNARVLVFGSRIKGNARPYSDLDIAIDNGQKLPIDVLFALKDALEESDLSYTVDCLDLHAISPDFQKLILQEYSLL